MTSLSSKTSFLFVLHDSTESSSLTAKKKGNKQKNPSPKATELKEEKSKRRLHFSMAASSIDSTAERTIDDDDDLIASEMRRRPCGKAASCFRPTLLRPPTERSVSSICSADHSLSHVPGNHGNQGKTVRLGSNAAASNTIE